MKQQEQSDAPAGRVLMAMAAFGLLLLIGLGVGALAERRFGAPVAAHPARMPVPQLLPTPTSERARIEAEARRRVDETRLRQAMRDAPAHGWDQP